ncbi:MAG: hypothetical protein DM484_01340 [Candidatus Methylumidiphilus alinenensis]|uniref:Uncharacterized protein n=1 Tax=Candidatus Methylumidiphilus alinenensis TaxID=2202197 RepID=A0A2W4RTZ7_9GAMM|nr:MAG: hypothetical protein DM484_01340 [Candidatus Methylumidiphilus alinenensis]
MKSKGCITVIFSMIMAFAFTFIWFNVIFFIPFSETLWSYFNHILGDNNPGFASDLELISVLIVSNLAFYLLIYVAIRAVGWGKCRRSQQTQAK